MENKFIPPQNLLVMKSKSNQIDFNGQPIFIGLDVHKKTWQAPAILAAPLVMGMKTGAIRSFYFIVHAILLVLPLRSD